jgi:hypothetical protein
VTWGNKETEETEEQETEASNASISFTNLIFLNFSCLSSYSQELPRESESSVNMLVVGGERLRIEGAGMNLTWRKMQGTKMKEGRVRRIRGRRI